MKRKDAYQFMLLSFLLAGLILFEYGKSFNFYFVGDDFSHIGFVMRERFHILWKSSNFFHYYPLGLFINSLPACFGVLDPQWFVAVNFLFYLGCSILVMKIFRDIAGSLGGGFLAALIFATAVPNSQVIYWKTGTQSIAMPFFALISLIFFMRYMKNGSKAAFAGTFAFYAISMLCIEQGIITLAILGLYDIVFFSGPRFSESGGDKKGVVLGLIRRHSILIAVPIVLTSLKLGLDLQLSPFPMATRNWALLPKVSVDIISQLLDLDRIILSSETPTSANAIVSIIIFLGFIGYALTRSDRKSLFFLVASFGSILAVCLAAGGPNARYFCLSLAFYACFLSIFLKDVAGAILWGTRKILSHANGASSFMGKHSGRIQAVLSTALCLMLALAGLQINLERRDYWEVASQIERNIVQRTEDLFLTGAIDTSAGQKLYLLNIPEHFVSKKHFIFYVASNSLMPDLRYRLGDSAQSVELIATGKLFELPLEKERVTYRALGWKEPLRMSDVRKLIEDGNVVMQFSPFTKTLVPVTP